MTVMAEVVHHYTIKDFRRHQHQKAVEIEILVILLPVVEYLLGQMSSFDFFYFQGGFLLRKKQAFQGSAIASFLRYASELATPALTILATV